MRVVSLSVLSLSMFLSFDALANSDLLGTWRAVAVERKGRKQPFPSQVKMTAEFKPKGEFVSRVSGKRAKQRRTGTWRSPSKGVVVTVMDNQTERAIYRIEDKRTLILTNPRTGQRLFLKRRQ